jgi:hypothetical protein
LPGSVRRIAPRAWSSATSSQAGNAPGARVHWATRTLAAAHVAADHSELWPSAALAAMSAAGWLPFVLAVVPLPSEGDLAFSVSSIVLSPSFPLNVVLPGAALFFVVVAASVLSATGEAVLLRTIYGLMGVAPAERSIDDAAARLWLLRLVASLPALAVVVAMLAMLAVVGPGEYQSPDLGRGPFLLRLALDVWPLIVLLVAAIVVGQAFAEGAARASIGPGRNSLRRALGAGVRGVLRRPLRRLAIALGVELALAGWLVATWALLHVLWTPIGRQAGTGALLSPGSAALLVGFVAIWLCLVAGGGMLHAWSSTWWSLEVGAPEIGTPREDGDRWT